MQRVNYHRPFRARLIVYCYYSTGYTRGYNSIALSGLEHLFNRDPKIRKIRFILPIRVQEIREFVAIKIFRPFRARLVVCCYYSTGYTRGFNSIALSGLRRHFKP